MLTGRSLRIVVGAISVAVYVFLLLPLIVIIPVSLSSSTYLDFPPPGVSLQWFVKLWDDPRWWMAAERSIVVGLMTTALALACGLPLAIALSRRLIRGADYIEKLVSAPLVVPGIIYAVAVYSVFGQLGLIGTRLGLALAHSVLALPFVVVLVTAGLRATDFNQELAARGLGASHEQAFLRVTFPQISSSVYSAAFFAFMTSFDELIVAIFISGFQPTLPKKIFDGIQIDIDPTVAAVCVVQMAILLMLMLVQGRSFRAASRVE
jgi:putative spermidine/putrescine transport system permease protein